MKKISNIWLIALILTVTVSFFVSSVSTADTQTTPNVPPGEGHGMD